MDIEKDANKKEEESFNGIQVSQQQPAEQLDNFNVKFAKTEPRPK